MLVLALCLVSLVIRDIDVVNFFRPRWRFGNFLTGARFDFQLVDFLLVFYSNHWSKTLRTERQTDRQQRRLILLQIAGGVLIKHTNVPVLSSSKLTLDNERVEFIHFRVLRGARFTLCYHLCTHLNI